MSQSAAAPLTLDTLDHLVLPVGDLQRTLAFYQDTLGMQPQSFETAQGEHRWALRFGTMKINLHLAGHEFDPKSARPTPGSADLCFLTETPIAQWQKHLDQMAVPVEEGPITRTGALGPLLSLYIRDPDGNLIEIANPQ